MPRSAAAPTKPAPKPMSKVRPPVRLVRRPAANVVCVTPFAVVHADRHAGR